MIIPLIRKIEIAGIPETLFPVNQVLVIKIEVKNVMIVIQGITLIGIDKIELPMVYMHSYDG